MSVVGSSDSVMLFRGKCDVKTLNRIFNFFVVVLGTVSRPLSLGIKAVMIC
jgi:hypothetical protein